MALPPTGFKGSHPSTSLNINGGVVELTAVQKQAIEIINANINHPGDRLGMIEHIKTNPEYATQIVESYNHHKQKICTIS